MSDVLFRGMEMPKNCGTCKFAGVCDVLPASEWPDIESIMLNDVIGVDGARDKDCPLFEIPPHGRLIEADALKKKHHWTDDFYETEYVEVEDIDAAPTIIPASEER